MSTNAAEFYKWLKIFGVETGGGGGVVFPITMAQGGTNANLTATANALFYSTATQGALLATPASSVLGSDVAGALTWSQTLPTGTQSVAPSTGNMVANKAYVDAVAAGLNPAQAVDAATVAPLTGYTYNNGASGIGATLTAGSNGVFQIDGITVPINEPVLYKNDVAGGGAWNGVYIVTDPGSVSTPAILTRAVYYDDPDNINNTGIIPVILGDVNQQSAWLLVSTVVTVGTSPLTYIQFGQTAGIIPLDKGGTNNNITPSLGGIVYSEALWLDVIAGTPTANLPLLSGSSAAPVWGAFPLSLGGALTTAGAVGFSGAFSFAATLTANTAVTFPVSGTLATTAQIPTPAALSTTNDTNVTLSLGGTPLTALLQAASITAGWTGLLAVNRGGTGVSTSTGSGDNVLNNGPTFIAPILGAASATSLRMSNTGFLDTNGVGILSFLAVASAVNYATIQNNTTLNNPKFTATGTDANIGIELQGKGTSGAYVFSQTSGSANPAGVRGEILTGTRAAGSAIGMTTTSSINVTTVTCTPGPWRITGNATIQTSGGSGSQFIVWVSATSATLPDISVRNGSTATSTYWGSSSQEMVVNPTVNTTYYLSAYCVFPGTATACGTITAERL